MWDGGTIHQSEAIKAILSQRPSRVHLAPLPPYCPELNLVEFV
ncbi:transposase [Spirosoma fluviale]